MKSILVFLVVYAFVGAVLILKVDFFYQQRVFIPLIGALLSTFTLAFWNLYKHGGRFPDDEEDD